MHVRISKKYSRCIYICVCLCYQHLPKHMYFKKNEKSFIKGIFFCISGFPFNKDVSLPLILPSWGLHIPSANGDFIVPGRAITVPLFLQQFITKLAMWVIFNSLQNDWQSSESPSEYCTAVKSNLPYDMPFHAFRIIVQQYRYTVKKKKKSQVEAHTNERSHQRPITGFVPLTRK